MPSNAPRAKRGQRVDDEQLSARILDVFSARAQRIGLSRLRMSELATQLRMSATTLYKLYPSKEALASACIERWADELGAAEAAKRKPNSTHDSFEQYMLWIDAWADANAALSPSFAHDLRADFPAVWRRYRAIVDERKRRGAALLRPLLKPEVNADVALAVLDVIFKAAMHPSFADQFDVSRREALRSAVAVWAGGAISRRAKLRSLQDARRKRR
jgi:AcrR family transcriptional regulator